MMISVALDAECHTVGQIKGQRRVRRYRHDVMGLQFDAIAGAPYATAHDAGPVIAFEDSLTPFAVLRGKMWSFRAAGPTMVRWTPAGRRRH